MGKHYLLYGHGGAYNHGAEAIVKTTIELLKRIDPHCRVTLSTNFKEQDIEFNIPADEFCERDFDYVRLDAESKTKGTYDELIYQPAIYSITDDTICLSVGGDNYCYPNWRRYAMIHYKTLERGAKSILWSCSIDPDAVSAEMLEALRGHHLITARESITYNALKKHGLNNVILCADTAFLLKKSETVLPRDFKMGDTVAINISPLTIRRESVKGMLIKSVRKLINYILENTDMAIALVPHVIMPMDNDCDAFDEILAGIPENPRVCYISPKLCAAEYKYVISNCRFAVAARTHACIAAYSSLVPTIAIGYSAKASGVARDLGFEEFVLSLESFKTTDVLCEAFEKLMQSEDTLRNMLAERIPRYVKEAESNYIKEFLC